MVLVGNYRNHAELRKKPRQQFHYNARIQIDSKSPLVTCAIVDISEGGARLSLEADETLPETFMLLLTRNGRTRRYCRVVWRDGQTLGVEFPQVDE
jgi:PilZ domain